MNFHWISLISIDFLDCSVATQVARTAAGHTRVAVGTAEHRPGPRDTADTTRTQRGRVKKRNVRDEAGGIISSKYQGFSLFKKTQAYMVRGI